MHRRDFATGLITGVVGGAVAKTAWGRGHTIPEFGRVTFSQQGEDIVLFHALHETLKIERPTYVDIGAAHPVQSNNTYLLYTTGGHGLLVEPNPVFVKLLRKLRPKDIVVQAGIGVTDTPQADYYEIKGNPMLNTFSPETVEALQKGKTESVVERVLKMPLININRLIAENLGSAPDLLSIDVEGLDTAILKTLDLNRFRPAVICVEGPSMFAHGYYSDIAKYLLAQNYIQRGGSMVNSVFVDARRVEI